MISLLFAALAGALTFTPQDFDGLRIGPVLPLQGVSTANFRHADLDGDGAIDLLFSNRAAFQRGNRFPPEHWAPLPSFDPQAELDTWGAVVYALSPRRLFAFRWDAGTWRTTLDQALGDSGGPTGPLADSVLRTGHDDPSGRLSRFLHDVSGDGVPEIVITRPEGVLLLRLENGTYTAAAHWDVLPPLTLTRSHARQVWPEAERRIAFPARHLACRLFINGPAVSVITRDDRDPLYATYETARYVIQSPRDSLVLAAPERHMSPVIPAHIRPCRLNAGAAEGYAGTRIVLSEASPLPMPIHEIWVSLDRGDRFHIERAPVLPGMQPHCSLLDFDGDGRLDIVTEESGLAGTGVREQILQFRGRAVLDHTIRVFLQQDGGFSRTPAATLAATLHLDAAPFFNTPIFQQYLAGGLVNLTGDFNKDGRRDLVFQDRPGRLVIHLGRPDGFRSQPDTHVAIPTGARFAVYDINGNGLSDLILRTTEFDGPAPVTRTQVLFTEDAAP